MTFTYSSRRSQFPFSERIVTALHVRAHSLSPLHHSAVESLSHLLGLSQDDDGGGTVASVECSVCQCEETRDRISDKARRQCYSWCVCVRKHSELCGGGGRAEEGTSGQIWWSIYLTSVGLTWGMFSPDFSPLTLNKDSLRLI